MVLLAKLMNDFKFDSDDNVKKAVSLWVMLLKVDPLIVKFWTLLATIIILLRLLNWQFEIIISDPSKEDEGV